MKSNRTFGCRFRPCLPALSVLGLAALVLGPSSAEAANPIADPGFEAGTPNPFWEEFSTNFGTPLCTVSCGGDGSGPNSGVWWAWFGGTVDFEEGSLTQSLVIPSTATTLKFELEQFYCDSPDDFLEVTIDGTQVFLTDGSSPLCGVLGYSTQSVDIRSFADGSTHTLEFYSQTFGTNGDITDFFVDDVAVYTGNFFFSDGFESGDTSAWSGSVP